MQIPRSPPGGTAVVCTRHRRTDISGHTHRECSRSKSGRRARRSYQRGTHARYLHAARYRLPVPSSSAIPLFLPHPTVVQYKVLAIDFEPFCLLPPCNPASCPGLVVIGRCLALVVIARGFQRSQDGGVKSGMAISPISEPQTCRPSIIQPPIVGLALGGRDTLRTH